jgi:hypothetical protein
MWIMWRVGVSGMDKKYSHANAKANNSGEGYRPDQEKVSFGRDTNSTIVHH